ncbi:MAG: hypothetical protein ACOYYJ_03295 [Chloroflexota bacterium]
MTDLSFPAELSWQLAAQEAAIAKHQYIQPGHLLVGICSLGSAIRVGTPGCTRVICRAFLAFENTNKFSCTFGLS